MCARESQIREGLSLDGQQRVGLTDRRLDQVVIEPLPGLGAGCSYHRVFVDEVPVDRRGGYAYELAHRADRHRPGVAGLDEQLFHRLKYFLTEPFAFASARPDPPRSRRFDRGQHTDGAR